MADLNTGLYTFLCTTLGVSGGTSYVDRVRSDGATNHWRLGETSGTVAVDAIGGANGTISGGVTLNQPSAMADGNAAMTFNGTTGKIATATAITLPSTVSIEGWIKTTSTVDYVCWFSNRDAALTGTRVFLAILGQQALLFLDRPSAVFLAGGKLICDGQWHHVVSVLTPTSGTVYVDGQMQLTGALTQQAPAALPVTLGFDYDTGHWFPGSVDDVSIYPRALTANEIAAHYSLGRSGLAGGNDLTTLITRYLATLSGDMTARWKTMEKNAGF